MPAAPRLATLPNWLHSRYVLGAAAAVALLMVALAVSFVVYEQRELRDAAVARGELYARMLEDQASRTVSAVDLLLGAAAETTAAHRADDHLGRLSALLQQSTQALPFVRSVSLVDGQGRVLASSSVGNLGLQFDRNRLMTPGRPFGLGPLLNGRDLADLAPPPAGAGTVPSTTQLLPMVRPLGADPGADWLVATLNPDYFANQYALLMGETPLHAALLSYDGQLLVPPEGSRHPAGTRLERHEVFSLHLNAGREHGQYLGTGIDGGSVFTAYRAVRRHPLVLVVETPEAEMQAGLRAIALNVALLTAGLLAMVGALAGLAWRSLRSHEAVSGVLLATRGSMAAQHAFTDRLFQVSPIPMVVKDTDGHFLRVNKAWTDFTGMSPEKLAGNNMGRLYPAHLAAPHEVQEQMAIASGQPVAYEEQMLDSDGLPRDVMIRLVPYTDVDGAVAGVIGCLMDVTEFREAAQRTLEAKEAAERSNATKTEFLANISHELRTPLQSILGFSELGTLRARQEPRLQGMFGDIHAAGERMLNLVNNLLDLSRLESTVGEFKLQPTDLDPVLRSVVAELQQMAAARQLRLAPPEAPPDPPLWVQADAFRLQQVLRNVLANAIRFAPAGSGIEVDWRAAEGGAVAVRVHDHGPGIPPDELESIFEAFVQSSRTKDGSGGTGLGLAICRKIMDAHHGRIHAFNHPDGGAVFEFTLPAGLPPVALAASSLPAGLTAG